VFLPAARRGRTSARAVRVAAYGQSGRLVGRRWPAL